MSQILSYLEQKGLTQQILVELVAQVQKDFQMSVSPNIVFKAQDAKELVLELERELQNIIASSSSSKLSSLLYRVDVNESEVEAIFNFEPSLEKMVYAILKREFQKVWIRNTL